MGKNTLLDWPSVKRKRLRARRPNLQCWLCPMSLVHDVGEAAVPLWATDLPHMCVSDVIEVKALSSYSYFIFWGVSISAAAWSCYIIKTKPNGNYEYCWLVWFDSSTDSKGIVLIIAVFRDRSRACVNHKFLYFHIMYFHPSTILTWKHIVEEASMNCS